MSNWIAREVTKIRVFDINQSKWDPEKRRWDKVRDGQGRSLHLLYYNIIGGGRMKWTVPVTAIWWVMWSYVTLYQLQKFLSSIDVKLIYYIYL
jgi:hypothetical protein